MLRLTIIVPDNRVRIDDFITKELNLSHFEELKDVHAVQWTKERGGHVEYVENSEGIKPENRIINDISEFNKIIKEVQDIKKESNVQPPNVNALKQIKKSELSQAMAKELDKGHISGSGIKVNAHPSDFRALQDAYNLALSLNENTLEVRDYENNFHKLDISVVKGIIQELQINYQEKRNHYWELVDKLNSIQDSPEAKTKINNIIWE